MNIADLDDDFEVPTTLHITAERVSDILCGAFEGGSNYWARVTGKEFAGDLTNEDFEYCHEIPFGNGCAVLISDVEGDSEYANKRLDWPAMQKGLLVMQEKYVHHFKNLIEENDDAETSDVFLQCSLFGEIIFG